MFNKADEFRRENGMWPPQSNKICGTWVKDQRAFGRKFMEDPESTNKITQERVDKLTQAGFVWNIYAKQVSSLIFVRLL